MSLSMMWVSVFPTPVGMVLQTDRGHTESASFPHARGDGPDGDGPAAKLRSWCVAPRVGAWQGKTG